MSCLLGDKKHGVSGYSNLIREISVLNCGWFGIFQLFKVWVKFFHELYSKFKGVLSHLSALLNEVGESSDRESSAGPPLSLCVDPGLICSHAHVFMIPFSPFLSPMSPI